MAIAWSKIQWPVLAKSAEVWQTRKSRVMNHLLAQCVALGLVTETNDDFTAAIQLTAAFTALERRVQIAEAALDACRKEEGARLAMEIQGKLDQARAMYPFLSLEDRYALCEAQEPELFAGASIKIDEL